MNASAAAAPAADSIRRARSGDRAARAVLLKQLQDPWYRLCRSLLRDDEQARDATQETAFRFLRDLPRYRGESSITTWSMGIAINVVREMRRSRQQGAETLDRRRLAAPRGGAPALPDESAQRSELDSILRATLDDLSDRQREAIVLRFFEDMSVEQTAQSMGCASGTVKATVHQALRILRDKLRQLS